MNAKQRFVEQHLTEKIIGSTRLRVPPMWLATKGEVYAFAAGAAAAASRLFNSGITARQLESCLAGISHPDCFGGETLILESLDDWGVIQAIGRQDAQPIYINTRKVAVNMLVIAAHNDGILCPRVMFAQEVE